MPPAPLRRAVAALTTAVLTTVSASALGTDSAVASDVPQVHFAAPAAVVDAGAPVHVSVDGCAGAVQWRATDGQGVTTSSGAADARELTVVPGSERLQPGIHRLTISCSEGSATGRFVVARPSARAPRADPFSGFSVTGVPGPDDRTLAAFGAVGAGSYRHDVQWTAVEKSRGRYDVSPYWPSMDRWVRDAGAVPLFVLDYGNPLYTGGAMLPPDPADPEQLAGWLGYVRSTVGAIAERYPDADLSFEVWNEWSNNQGGADRSPRGHVALLEATAPVIREAAPNARIVGPAQNAATAAELDWLEQWFAAGGIDLVDVVSVHPYTEPWAPEQASPTEPLAEGALRTLRTWIDAHNAANRASVQLWISEVGWPTGQSVHAVPEGDLAAYLARLQLVAAAAGVERVFLFELVSRDPRSYGITEPRAVGVDPKPAVAVHLTQRRVLAGLRPVSSSDRDGVRTVCFRDDDGSGGACAVWTTTGRFAERPTSVVAGSGGRVIGPSGATIRTFTGAGAVPVAAGWAPSYVEWD